MIQPLPSPATAAPAPAETPAERVERQARGLREMQAIILSIARAEEQVALARAAQAMNAAEAGLAPAAGSRPAQSDRADPALAISRIARALRLTQAMENRLYDDLAAGPATRAAPTPLGQWAPQTTDERRKAAGMRGCILASTILPAVEQVIEAAEDPKGDGSDTERRFDHLDERLQDEDEMVRFGTLPIGASIARLCADLGLTPDWSLWEDEDWAIEEAETDAPGSPYGRSWTGVVELDDGDGGLDRGGRTERVDAHPPPAFAKASSGPRPPPTSSS